MLPIDLLLWLKKTLSKLKNLVNQRALLLIFGAVRNIMSIVDVPYKFR